MGGHLRRVRLDRGLWQKRVAQEIGRSKGYPDFVSPTERAELVLLEDTLLMFSDRRGIARAAAIRGPTTEEGLPGAARRSRRERAVISRGRSMRSSSGPEMWPR